MKKGIIAGYAVAFIAGSVMSGTAAMAATKYVQAQLGNATYTVNGKVVGKSPKLVYGGTTYVQLYSIQQALKNAGFTNTWDGSKNPGVYNIVIPVPTSQQSSQQSELPVELVTLANFDKLQVGMTLEQAMTIVGNDGHLLNQNLLTTEKNYVWYPHVRSGGSGASLTVQFMNGKLTSKDQFRLVAN